MVRYLRWPALAVAGALALGLQVVEAQVTATVVLKSGERHTGRNVGYRLDRREVSVRTSQHEEPRVPVDRVAYIDFGGAPEVEVSLSGAQEAAVLRDGTIVRGQIVEVGHVNPADESSEFVVTIRTQAGEERRLPAGQVGRVYFAGGAAAAPTTGEARLDPPTGEGVTVSARQQWTPTGLIVRSGEQISFASSGQIQLSADAKDIANPAGSLLQRKAPASPLPELPAGALIGRIGTGKPFAVGDQTMIPMPGSGQLFLGINDDELSDNRGEFRVKVQRAGRGRR